VARHRFWFGGTTLRGHRQEINYTEGRDGVTKKRRQAAALQKSYAFGVNESII
jgi:hypothetical protein